MTVPSRKEELELRLPLNLKGLTCHPIRAAAIAGKKTCEVPAHRPVTPMDSNNVQARSLSTKGVASLPEHCGYDCHDEQQGREIAEDERYRFTDQDCLSSSLRGRHVTKLFSLSLELARVVFHGFFRPF
jgi:hypothetical protein